MRALLLLAVLAAAFWAGWLTRDAQEPAVPVAFPVPVAPPVPVEGPDHRLLEFEAALAAGDHDSALELYEDVADPGREPDLTARFRARIFEPVRAPGGSSAAVAEAVAFLEAFTWLYGRDEAALTALAQGQERLGRLEEALDTWWRLADAVVGGDAAERIRRRARVLVATLADGARTRGDRSALADLYREALRRDPDAHRFRVLLADILDEDGAHEDALAVLATIPAGAIDDGRIERMRYRVAESARLQTAYPDGLPLRALGEHFVVEVGTLDGGVLELMVDTGASLTVLRPGVVGRIRGAEPMGVSIRVATAGGVVDAPLYGLDGLSLGTAEIRDVSVAVMALEGLEEVDGLLGLDPLAEFDYRIDPLAGRLLLSLRRD